MSLSATREGTKETAFKKVRENSALCDMWQSLPKKQVTPFWPSEDG